MNLRFPGGSNADYYDWNTNNANPTPLPASANLTALGQTLWPFDSYADKTMDFDAFMNQVVKAHETADITVNYGNYAGNITQGANEAAAWVAYANANASPTAVQNTYGIKIGGAGTQYGTTLSSNGHAYGIKYWEIGNEVYGDGTYGTAGNAAHWEYDTVKGPVNYASVVSNIVRR
jgi:alpha-L-arabinofuranosidase